VTRTVLRIGFSTAVVEREDADEVEGIPSVWNVKEDEGVFRDADDRVDCFDDPLATDEEASSDRSVCRRVLTRWLVRIGYTDDDDDDEA